VKIGLSTGTDERQITGCELAKAAKSQAESSIRPDWYLTVVREWLPQAHTTYRVYWPLIVVDRDTL